MTTANKVTIVRILLVPVFAYELLVYLQSGSDYHRWWALGVFLLISIGDGIDGFVARRFNQKTELGAFLDPLADKLLLVVSLLLLSLHNNPNLARIPLWLTMTVVTRDIVLLLLTVLVAFLVGSRSVRPHLFGKVATVLQMACIVWVLGKLRQDLIYPLALLATVMTALSGLIYLAAGIRMLQARSLAGH